MHAPLPSTVQALLQLFEGPLREVRFPEADAATIGAAAEELNHARADVEEAESALATAREALKTKEAQLLQRAQRALAYVRVYAEDKPELLASLPSPTKSKRPPPVSDVEASPKKPGVRRGRPAREVKEARSAE